MCGWLFGYFLIDSDVGWMLVEGEEQGLGVGGGILDPFDRLVDGFNCDLTVFKTRTKFSDEGVEGRD